MQDNEKKAVKADVKKYAALEAVARSEGGQILIDSLIADMVVAIEEICNKAKTGSEVDLRIAAIKLSERLIMYRTLDRSSINKQDASDELKKILKEEKEQV